MPDQLTTQNVTGIFDLDGQRLVGLAAKGVPDPTFVLGGDTFRGALSPSSLAALTASGLTPGGLARQSLVIDGDSQTANGYQVTATYKLFTNRGWWVHCLAQMGWPYEVVNVPAVPGENMQQILARFDASVAAFKPRVTWLFPGQNNLLDTDDGVAFMAACRTYAEKVRDLGSSLVIFTTTPREGASQTATVAKNVTIFHAFFEQLAREGLCFVVDIARAVTNIQSANGALLSGMTYDGQLHLSAKACVRIAKTCARLYPASLRRSPFLGPLSNQDSRQSIATSKQLLANPKLIGNTTAATAPAAGFAPDNMQLQLVRSGTSTSTVTGTGNVADPDGTERVFYQLVFGGTKTDGADDLAILNVSAQFASMVAPVTPGVDSVDYARIAIKASNVSANFSYIKLQIEALNGSTPLFEATCEAETTTAQGEISSDELTFNAPGFLIPAGTTRIRWNVKIAYGAGACTGTFLLSDAEVRIV